MTNSQTLIAATAAGLPLFITHGGARNAFAQIDEHLAAGGHHPGYELSLFHVLDALDMSFHSVRRSNRPDAAERPYLVSHAFLVGGPGEERESARFYFNGMLMSFRSGDELVGCEVWQDGEDVVQLEPVDAIKALQHLLSKGA